MPLSQHLALGSQLKAEEKADMEAYVSLVNTKVLPAMVCDGVNAYNYVVIRFGYALRFGGVLQEYQTWLNAKNVREVKLSIVTITDILS